MSDTVIYLPRFRDEGGFFKRRIAWTTTGGLIV
jgi:hypothetical protein